MKILLFIIGGTESAHISGLDGLLVSLYYKRMFQIESNGFLLLFQVTVHQVSVFKSELAAGDSAAPINQAVFHISLNIAQCVAVIRIGTANLIIRRIPCSYQVFVEQPVLAFQLGLPELAAQWDTILLIGIERCSIFKNVTFKIGMLETVVEHVSPRNLMVPDFPTDVCHSADRSHKLIAFTRSVQTVFSYGVHLFIFFRSLFITVGQSGYYPQFVSVTQFDRSTKGKRVVLYRHSCEFLHSESIFQCSILRTYLTFVFTSAGIPLAVIHFTEQPVGFETLVAQEVFSRTLGVHTCTQTYIEKLLTRYRQGLYFYQSSGKFTRQVGSKGLCNSHIIHQTTRYHRSTAHCYSVRPYHAHLHTYRYQSSHRTHGEALAPYCCHWFSSQGRH